MPVEKPKWKKRLAPTLCSMLLLCVAIPISAFADDVHIATAYQPFIYFEKYNDAKLHALPMENSVIMGRPEKASLTREVEAESIAYVVCQHFGIDTSDYSFAYATGWSRGKELPELKASLGCISKTAAEMIDALEATCVEPSSSLPALKENGKKRFATSVL